MRISICHSSAAIQYFQPGHGHGVSGESFQHLPGAVWAFGPE
jgi:hypothetical protein